MIEWWSYRPSDFLMFAPRTYWRLFELHNQAWWPAPLLLLLTGLLWLLWLPRHSTLALRAGTVGLALAWAFVGWFFLHERYAPVNWVMTWGAYVFLAQALGLAVLGIRNDLKPTPSRAARSAGLLLCGWALLGQPLLALAFDRPWRQAEVFGLAPDPTVIATLGLLVLVAADAGATRWLLRALWGLALAWCAVSAATLWTMGSAQGWVPCVAGIGAAWAHCKSRRIGVD
jgi:hypothetical protein